MEIQDLDIRTFSSKTVADYTVVGVLVTRENRSSVQEWMKSINCKLRIVPWLNAGQCVLCDPSSGHAWSMTVTEREKHWRDITT